MAEGIIFEGCILLARKLISNELAHTRVETFKCAIMELLLANHKPQNWWDGQKSLLIKRGQFVTSIKNFAQECRLSKQNIRTSWAELEKLKFSTHKPTHRYTVVTIRNYNYFQNFNNYKPTQPLTHSQHKPNTSLTLNNNDNNVKNVNKRDSSSGSPTAHLTDSDFIQSLKANPAYSHIDIDRELGKMDAWLLTHKGRKKTRRFVVNWLNKIDKPLDSQKPKADIMVKKGQEATDKVKKWKLETLTR